MGVREDRLWAEYNELRQFRSTVLTWETLGSNQPPDHYIIYFDLKSIVDLGSNGVPKYHQGFKVEFKFPVDFPRNGPGVRFTDKPWPRHPNIYSSGRICLEGAQHWIAGIGVPLASMCYMVGQIIAFQEINLSSPARSDSAIERWITNNLTFSTKTRVINPVDPSPIRMANLEDAINWGGSSTNQSGPHIKFG